MKKYKQLLQSIWNSRRLPLSKVLRLSGKVFLRAVVSLTRYVSALTLLSLILIWKTLTLWYVPLRACLIAEKLPKAIENISTLEKVRKEESNDTRIKGGGKKGLFED